MVKMHGYQSILNNLLDDENLDSVSLHILIFFNSFPKDVYPSEKTIAQKIKQSIRTVQRRLKKLQNLGYLKIDRYKNFNHCNRYYLNYEKIRPARQVGHNGVLNALDAPTMTLSQGNYDFKSQSLRHNGTLCIISIKNKNMYYKVPPAPFVYKGSGKKKQCTNAEISEIFKKFIED
jgi:predicted transcriptional regulator